MTIQPIETRYAGCRFRSRLEARWAVFFDALDIRWEYEPQGFTFTTPGGERFHYLPDFYLPDLGTWVEVKGSDDELNRVHIECAAINLSGSLVILGPIPKPSEYEWAWLSLSRFEDEQGTASDDLAHDMWVGFNGSVTPGILRTCTETSTATNYEYPDLSWLEPTIDATLATAAHAYEAARSARFEHGESGAPTPAPEESAADLAPQATLVAVMLQHPEVIPQVDRLVEAADFPDECCKLLFTGLTLMSRRGDAIDALTVWAAMANAGAKPGGRLHATLKELMVLPGKANPNPRLAQLRDDPARVTFALKWMLEEVEKRRARSGKSISSAAREFLDENADTWEAYQARRAKKNAVGETP